MLYLKYPRLTRNEQERDFMAKTKLCKYCKSQIDKKASICPHCQKKQSGIGDAFKCVIAAIALIIFVPLFVSACNGVKKGYKDAEQLKAYIGL